MADTNFKIDSADYLGIANENFKQSMLELAISEPKKYFLIRRVVLEKIKKAAVEGQYKIYYHLLTEARLPPVGNAAAVSILAGTDAAAALAGNEGEVALAFCPSVPKQIVNEFALAAAKTIDAIAERAIEMILPSNFATLAADRVTKKTAGDLFQG